MAKEKGSEKRERCPCSGNKEIAGNVENKG